MKEALERAQSLPESDFLSRFQLEVEVLGGLEDEHNGGAQVELAQVLALAHGDALLVHVRHEAEVIVGALAVPWAVCVQVLWEMEAEHVDLEHTSAAVLNLSPTLLRKGGPDSSSGHGLGLTW